ncbi:hypothetical protein CF326_g953 [Tilletia indica]|nr:hypothetical protein CF326_g953 [Tilletia indica]
MFSFSQPQQQQQQPAQANNTFSFGQPQAQQQQQQPQQQQGLFGANPSTPGPLSVNDLNRQQQQQQQGFQFGQQQQQQPQQQPQLQPGFQTQQHSSSLYGARSMGSGHPGLHHSSSSGSLYGSVGTGVPGAGQTNPVYVPGYLSKIRSNKPYASNRRVSGHHSPTNDDDANTSRDADGRGTATSPTHAFQSSFFSSRSPTMDDRVSNRAESIFGPGGLRGNRRSVGPGGAAGSAAGAGSWGDDGSMRGSVGPGGGLRRSASGVFAAGPAGAGRDASAMAMDEEEDLPPVQGLREGNGAGGGEGSSPFGFSASGRLGLDASSSYANRLGASTASRSSPANGLGASLGAAGASAAGNGSSSGSNGSSDPTRTLLIFGFPAASKTAVLRFFESIGEIVALTPVSSLDNNAGTGGIGEGAQLGGAQYDAIQITYAEQWCALRALRRNGDVIAGAGCRIGIRFANENLHREIIQNGINSAVLASATAAVLANGGDVGDAGRPMNAVAPSPVPEAGGASSGNLGASLNNPQARQMRETTPAFGRPISRIDTPNLVLRTPGSGGSGASSTSASPFAKAAANIFGGATSGSSSSAGSSSVHASPAGLGHGRSASAVPPSSLFRTALSNSPAPAQSGSGSGQTGALVSTQQGQGKGGANAAAQGAGAGLGQRLSDAIFGW